MQTEQDQTTGSNAEAELIFTFANRAPEIVLSFEGLSVPTPLFVDLNRLGWSIPAVPPPPSSAIEWTPDPVAGTDYTLRPWRVTEFRLDSGTWAESSERAIGGLTIEVLKRHSVTITELRGLSEAEAQAATGAGPAVDPNASALSQVAASMTPAAETPTSGADVIFVYDPEPDSTMAGFRAFGGLRGRKKVACSWHEGVLSEGAQVPAAEVLADLTSRGGGVWHLSGDIRPPAANVQMLAPEMGHDDPQLAKLLKLTGAGATVIPLASISGGSDAVIVCVQVPSHSIEMLGSNLRIRFPDLVFRAA